MEFKHLEEVLDRYGRALASEYSMLAPKGAKHKLADVTFGIEHNGAQYMVYLDLQKYWKYVEYGRGPGKRPPEDAILEWVRLKPVIPREKNGIKPTNEQLAFLISRSIGENGTVGQHPLELANNKVYDQMMESIAHAFLEDIEEDFDQVWSLVYRT